MQKRLHKFMDNMRDKPVEDRRKILFGSTISLGVIITIFGLWNISSSLVSLNTNSDEAVLAGAPQEANTPSLFASLENSIASVWGTVRGNLQKLNDKLGASNGQ